MTSKALIFVMFLAIAHCHVIHDVIDAPEDWVGVTPPYAVEPGVNQGRWAKRQHWSPHLSPGGKRQHWSLSLAPGGKRSFDDAEADDDSEQGFLGKIRNDKEWKTPQNFSYFLKLLQRYLADQNRKDDYKW